MNKSTPSNPKPLQNKSICLIGPPGGGKTTLALQFPSLYVIDCDENLDGPENYLRSSIMPNLEYSYDSIYDAGNGKRRPVHQCYDYLITLLDRAKNEPTIKTVIIDSLTHVNEFIIQKIMFDQKRTEMTVRDWIPFKSAFLLLLVSKLRGLGKHTICIVHETIVKEPDKHNITAVIEKRYEPSVQGSIGDYFGAFFTDIWRCESRPVAGNKTAFYVTTAKTAKSDLKNSCGMPYEIVNPTFSELNKYLKIS